MADGGEARRSFKENPVLNSPYEEPRLHWPLNGGVPVDGADPDPGRRESMDLISVPASRKSKEAKEGQLFESYPIRLVNRVRALVERWRARPLAERGLTYVTRRLLEHWASDKVSPRLFFCQREAAETLIWLNEVAPTDDDGKKVIEDIRKGNRESNSDLYRLACKMATGSGKTTVMAMLIAYHTLNKVRDPRSPRFVKHFLVVAPGITVRDRLRVLLPEHEKNYYREHDLIPPDMRGEIGQAKVVVTNYHAFQRSDLPPPGAAKMTTAVREVLRGTDKEAIDSKESEGQMLRRVCPVLLRAKEVLVINDEAHHCYRHKDDKSGTGPRLSTEEKAEAEKYEHAAHRWITGVEALGRKVKLHGVYDLSATPFFLRGSGHRAVAADPGSGVEGRGNLFPWVVSDFSLLDAIESGIVKTPRVPVDHSQVGEEDPTDYRNLYESVGATLPKKQKEDEPKERTNADEGGSKRRASKSRKRPDPEKVDENIRAALETLYADYDERAQKWEREGFPTPPVFIIVCNNTLTSRLMYDLVSGYEVGEEGSGVWKQGMLRRFSNVDKFNIPLVRPRTILVDSVQLESGEGLSKEFRKVAAREIEDFKREWQRRHGDKAIKDEVLLREVMNTVGQQGRLGEQVRCVVSVSMLTEGWDARNVTHIFGLRRFGTQLLCEQVVGRALRRYSYDNFETEGPNKGLYHPEYAEIFGVPFSFATGGKASREAPERPKIPVFAMEEREHLEITFPNVRGYKFRFPEKTLKANFTEEKSSYTLPDIPYSVTVSGLIGEEKEMTMEKFEKQRLNKVVFSLVDHMTKHHFEEDSNGYSITRFRNLIQITRRWIEEGWLRGPLRADGTHSEAKPPYLLLPTLASEAAVRINRSLAAEGEEGEGVLFPIFEPYNREGSTEDVNYQTSTELRVDTGEERCHVNIATFDSSWEHDFCVHVLERDPRVLKYARNEGLNFRIPYTHKGLGHDYHPDFIAVVDDGRGPDDPLNLIVEIKGERDAIDDAKADTARNLWVAAVNNHGGWGRWDFLEIGRKEEIETALSSFLTAKVRKNGRAEKGETSHNG